MKRLVDGFFSEKCQLLRQIFFEKKVLQFSSLSRTNTSMQLTRIVFNPKDFSAQNVANFLRSNVVVILFFFLLSLLQVILPLMLLYSYILEKNCRTIRIYTWFWSMYQGEKCSVIWGGSDALGRLIWVISRKIILIWGFSLSLIVNFFLRELLLSCFVFLIDDFVWLKKKNQK